MNDKLNTEARSIDWVTAIADACPCGHGHNRVQCTVEACDCSGYRASGVDLVFSVSAKTWGLRAGGKVAILPKGRNGRTSRQVRVDAIRAAAS